MTTRIKTSGMAATTTDDLSRRIRHHLRYSRCKDLRSATDYDKLTSLMLAVRDLAMDRMIATQQTYLDQDAKRVYYLSMEFLIGRLLLQNILATGVLHEARAAVAKLGITLEQLLELEPDAGLGNGGLGRLAACFMDSLASMGYPGYGYGIRYEHGMFRQEFENGWQMERPDDWLKLGSAWEMVRPEYTVPVTVYGRVEQIPNRQGVRKPVWVDWQMFEGVPYDIPVVGFDVNNVNILRLWRSRATEGFRLDVFNRGEYTKAVEEKNWAETVSQVLYPNDNTANGKELRLIQEYFLVTCSIRDIMRRYLKNHRSWDDLPGNVAIQMNDTHPALTVAELMRYLMDEADLPAEKAWDLTRHTLGYTNHTLLPEALEKWSVPLMEKCLPRHLQIIYAINERFLQQIRLSHPGDDDLPRRVSLIEEGEVRQVRMAHLAIVGSHSVNGVAALHTALLKQRLVPDFARLWPEKFNNKTNGISHRVWLLKCNPALTELVTEAIGADWVRNPEGLVALEKFAADASFREKFRAIKHANKQRLAAVTQQLTGIPVDPAALFDVQVKRMHEYKRQLLNVMHILTLFHRIKAHPELEMTPRTFIFGAKAAPGYHMAKLIIKLINTLADAINRDPDVRRRIQVVYLPDYCVSLAEQIIPAADLSEQISTAGTEASGTGNMKLALNGALTIGTWDGANIEIAEHVGLENFFVFGQRVEQLADLRKSYNPQALIAGDEELRRVVFALRDNPFVVSQPQMFRELYQSLAEWGDPYFHLADYRSYLECQQKVADLYQQPDEWSRKAVLNVARVGWFSSDRTIREYAEQIWGLKPVAVDMNGQQRD